MAKKLLGALLLSTALFVGHSQAATTPISLLFTNGKGLCFSQGATSAQNSVSVCPATSSSIGGVKPGQNVTIDPNVGTLTVGGVYRGPWAANTSYLAGDLVTYGTTLYTANAGFTSGSSFVAGNWAVALQGGGGSSGALLSANNLNDLASAAQARSNLGLGTLSTLNSAPGGLRGPWAANTAYSQFDQVTYNGVLYSALASFTSGTTFSGSNWALVPHGLPVIALTNSTPGATVTLVPGNAYDVTMAANTTFALGAAAAGSEQFVDLFVRENGTGGFIATLPTGVKYPSGTAPALGTAANNVAFIRYKTPDAGSTWIGSNQ
jgi:hypothetical protein